MAAMPVERTLRRDKITTCTHTDPYKKKKGSGDMTLGHTAATSSHA